MSEVRLIVREAERDWSGTIHGSDADHAVAALSADPVTMQELEVAAERFAQRIDNHPFFGNLRYGHGTEPYDAGLVVIDLVARLVVVDSSYSNPGRSGYVTFHNGRCASETVLRYHLADDWLFLCDGDNWEGTADARRKERAEKPVRDVRKVLYERPLLELIGRECFAAFARRDEIAAAARAEWIENARQRLAREADIGPGEVDASLLTEEEITPKTWSGEDRHASSYYAALKEIHAAWLLTPRDDLDGKSPRDVGLERRGHIGWDLQDRCEQWSKLRECPRGLDESSHAFKFGGLGTHELVMYYDLVRELLWSCWGRLTELAQASDESWPRSFTVGDFLAAEVPRLETVRESWLDSPDIEHHGRTPRSIIQRERARIPEAVSGHDAIVDPDCPCCQMMADLPGPVFWHLDGCEMDDEFAFDIMHRTREEWDAERREWDEQSKKFNAEWAERKLLGVTDSSPRADGSNAVWRRSFSVGDTADVPLGVRVFGIGGHLAELIVGLRSGVDRDATPLDVQQRIDQLNRSFGNLRELLQSSDASLAVALLDPVLDRFNESLDDVASARSDLAAQCENLREGLQKLLDPAPPEPTWETGDDDIPF